MHYLTNNLRGPLRDVEHRIGYVTNAADRHGTKGNESDRLMQRIDYCPANALPACRARWDVAKDGRRYLKEERYSTARKNDFPAYPGFPSICYSNQSVRVNTIESELLTPRRARYDRAKVNPDQKPKYDRVYVPIENAKLDGLLLHPNGRLGTYRLKMRRIFLAILSLLLCSCASFSSPQPGDYIHNRCGPPGSGDPT